MLSEADYDDVGCDNPVYGKYQGTVFNNVDPDKPRSLAGFRPQGIG